VLSPRLLATAVCAAGLLVLAPSAHALIAPNDEIGGVRLGMTEAQVVERLGPFAKKLVGDEPEDYTVTFPKRRLLVNLLAEPDRVFLVATTDRRQRSKLGLGPGVTERKLRRALARQRLRCGKLFDADRRLYVTDCATPARSNRQTTYRLRRGRIIEVIVEYVAPTKGDPPPTPGTTRIYTLFGGPMVRPKEIFLTANAGPSLKDLAWEGWGTDGATAEGAFVSDCASCPPEKRRPAKVVLTGLKLCPAMGGWTYRTGTLTTWGDRSTDEKTIELDLPGDWFCRHGRD
jgi:hypothetical protein